MAASDIQVEAMRVYHALVELRPEQHPAWGGGLVLLCGPGCVSGGAAAAVSIAGGATLAIDCDAPAMKAAMRAGYLDFVVNSLDEALRALKNQVRMRRPLGVGLIADVDATLAEMVERGVQPDLQIVPADDAVLIEVQRSATGRGFGPQATSAHLPMIGSNQPVVREGLSECFFAAANAAELAAIDASLLALIGDDDLVRRWWVQRVPQYLREARTGGRWIWLSDAEREQFAADASVGQG